MSASPPMRSMLDPRDPRQRVYTALMARDVTKEGIVSVEDFNDALREAGVEYGSDQCDKLMSQITILDNGNIDYFRWAEDIESLLSTPYPEGHSSRCARVTDFNAYGQEEYKEMSIKQRDKILGQKERIYRAFCEFESGHMAEEHFVNFLLDCGVDPSPELNKLLKTKRTEGYMHFSELLRIACLPGKRLTDAHLPPVSSREEILWESQKRGTDVVAWRQQPPRERVSRQVGKSTVQYAPDVDLVELRRQELESKRLESKDIGLVGRTRQERLYAVIRDFIQAEMDAPSFRAVLHDLGIIISAPLETLINRVGMGQGGISFGQFVKAINLEEQWKLKPVEGSQTIAAAARHHGDVIGWRDPPIDEPSTGKGRGSHKFQDGSGNFLVWGRSDIPDAPTPRSPHPKAQSNSRGNPLAWDESNTAATYTPPRRTESHAHADTGDIFTWRSDTHPNEAAFRSERRGSGRSAHAPAPAARNPLVMAPARRDGPEHPHWKGEALATRPW